MWHVLVCGIAAWTCGTADHDLSQSCHGKWVFGNEYVARCQLKARQYFTIAQVVYVLTTGISKLAIALVLYRLAHGAGIRLLNLILTVSMVVVSAVALVVALIIGLQCRPLSVAWGVGSGTYMSTTIIANAAMVLSAVNVAASWLYGVRKNTGPFFSLGLSANRFGLQLLPVWMLYKTQMPIRLKVTVLFLLRLGAV